MNRYLGFHQGRMGDIAMSTVAARILKKHDPSCHLTFIVGSDNYQFTPLLYNNLWIDRLYVTHKGQDGFDRQDQQWITDQRFTHVFNPLQDHPEQNWFLSRQQAIETAFMHGLPTGGESAKIQLTRWFKDVEGLRGHVAFAPFAGAYSMGNDKQLTTERAQEVVNLIRCLGFKVLHIGGATEPRLEGAEFRDTSYFESIRNIVSCKCFVHTDTGAGWIVSAYDTPALGLYSHRYYGPRSVQNIQPENPNARYLDAHNVNQIDLGRIEHHLKGLLS